MIALAVCLLIGGAAVLINVFPLVRAGHRVTDPERAVAVTVRLESPGGKGATPRATVTYDTPSGRYRAQLPLDGHSANAYGPPVRLVYDRNRPGRVLLASDWRAARSGGTTAKLWLGGSAVGVGVVLLLGVAISSARRRRSLRRG